MTRARDIANFGDGIATADIDDGAVTAGKLNSTLDLTGKTVTLPSGVGGKVLQVVQNVRQQNVSTTSTSFTASGHNVSITPSSASNKILVQWHGATLSRGPGTNGRCWVTIYRGGTNLGHSTEGMNGADGDGQLINTPMALSYLDSPNTTSEITYSVYFRSNSGAIVECPPWGSAKLTLTAMEIAG